jgi:arylformamidase
VRIIDISASLRAGIEPWPGDTPFEFGFAACIADGSAVNVGSLSSSVHNGTHVDAPLHVIDGGAGAAELPLEAFIGPAVVVDAEETIGLSGRPLEEAVGRGTRVLLRWGRSDHQRFPDSVRAVPPDWIDRLAALDVPLLGTDQPSVDPLDSKSLRAHRACVRGGMQILENLVLAHVKPGPYDLVALPLRLAEADASPVRAVLIDNG